MSTNVSQRLSFFSSLYRVDEQPELGMWYLYFTILVLSIIVFKLGFAKRLPILKAAVIYLFLALGCTVLTFLGIFLPVAEGLVVAALILIIYKIRLYLSKRGDQESGA
ncbi:YlaH-like family protein [Bacillus carboniphilus]|uniref:YlaH-like family protein n=1 Tax=Bacillus carboniphilus TaxID=86663 RepID=A0ABY9K084_9BACI|nr:YlaH-like family protein [Bacillus carboniphilus]WLR43306.1 YlaH-like family protein [Bacillus carboniphilus]